MKTEAETLHSLTFFIIISIIAVSLLICSCSTISTDIGAYESGTYVSPQNMNSAIDGKSSQSDIVGMIGHPNKKEQVNDKEIWYYDYTKIRQLGENISESTVFEFDTKGSLLRHYKTGKSGNPLIEAAGKSKN